MASEQSIAQELLAGLDEAYDAYENMSGESLDHAPEYYITVVLAQTLSRGEKNRKVFLERSVKATLKAAKSRKPGNRALSERRDGRFDILLERNDEPICAIEIKSPHCWPKTIPDMARICSVLKHHTHKSTLRSGAICFYAHWDKSRTEDIESLGEKILDHAKKVFKSGTCFDFDCVLTASPKRQGDRAVLGRAYCLFVEINYYEDGNRSEAGRFLNHVD